MTKLVHCSMFNCHFAQFILFSPRIPAGSIFRFLWCEYSPSSLPSRLFWDPTARVSILVGQHPRGFANVACFKNERIVKHERQELVERHFLLADLPARIAKTLQIRRNIPGTENR